MKHQRRQPEQEPARLRTDSTAGYGGWRTGSSSEIQARRRASVGSRSPHRLGSASVPGRTNGSATFSHEKKILAHQPERTLSMFSAAQRPPDKEQVVERNPFATSPAICRVDRLTWVWFGGEYIDGYLLYLGENHPDNKISQHIVGVWDHGQDRPAIPYTVEAMQATVEEYCAL